MEVIHEEPKKTELYKPEKCEYCSEPIINKATANGKSMEPKQLRV